MCPGESVEKHILSCHDLRRHSELVHVYAPRDIVSALDSEGFGATVENSVASEIAEDDKKIVENMGDLICFGSKEVKIWILKWTRSFARSCVSLASPDSKPAPARHAAAHLLDLDADAAVAMRDARPRGRGSAASGLGVVEMRGHAC